jgi:hypothetical protein
VLLPRYMLGNAATLDHSDHLLLKFRRVKGEAPRATKQCELIGCLPLLHTLDALLFGPCRTLLTPSSGNALVGIISYVSGCN